MRPKMKFLYSIPMGLAAFCVHGTANASEIGSGGSIEKGRALDIHETITDLALECVQRSAARPADCSDLHPKIKDKAAANRREDTQTQSYAARWPDDPQRVLDQTSTQIRFGLPLLEGCKTAFENGEAINRVGLLCASHFGRLQFMHAMTAADGPKDLDDQRKLVLAWADFAFRAATDRAFGEQPYCDTISNLDNENLKRSLTFDNVDAENSFCKTRQHPVFIWKEYAPWKVSTLFSFSCEEPINLNTCGVVSDDLARKAAAGAVLHLIQDSYSQSHASRRPDGVILPPTGPFLSEVVCEPVRAFYVYQDQIAKVDAHKPADLTPDLHANCAPARRKVDDVITASANAIYFMNNSDLEGFRNYLAERVFPQVAK